jgi:hypothetical protein
MGTAPRAIAPAASPQPPRPQSPPAPSSSLQSLQRSRGSALAQPYVVDSPGDLGSIAAVSLAPPAVPSTDEEDFERFEHEHRRRLSTRIDRSEGWAPAAGPSSAAPSSASAAASSSHYSPPIGGGVVPRWVERVELSADEALRTWRAAIAIQSVRASC